MAVVLHIGLRVRERLLISGKQAQHQTENATIAKVLLLRDSQQRVYTGPLSRIEGIGWSPVL